MKFNSRTLLIIAAALAGGVSPALGAPFAYTNGNLILGFQATGGTGSGQNVFYNLGSGTGFRDNGNQGTLGNIGATLASVYGSDWYTREDLWFGVIGNLNPNTNSGIGSAAAVNGDPSRTFYLSAAAATPGAGPLIAASSYPGASLGSAGGILNGTELVLLQDPTTGVIGGLQAEADGSGILDSTNQDHATAWANSWSQWNPVPGASYTVFTGGIQQNFGKAGGSTYVDVQRVLSTNTGAIPTGVVGGGTYETTIAISSSGVISSQAATAATAYDTWIAAFPSITAPANRLTTADPDGDGATNLEEFGFGGNPESSLDGGMGQIFTVDANSDTQRDITLTLEVRSGATFSGSGSDLVSAVIDQVSYRIEGSTDLLNWDSAVTEVTPPLSAGSASSGYTFKSFRLNAGNGLGGKGFLRASVTK